jgi:hypothetical protein
MNGFSSRASGLAARISLNSSSVTSGIVFFCEVNEFDTYLLLHLFISWLIEIVPGKGRPPDTSIARLWNAKLTSVVRNTYKQQITMQLLIVCASMKHLAALYTNAKFAVVAET